MAVETIKDTFVFNPMNVDMSTQFESLCQKFADLRSRQKDLVEGEIIWEPFREEDDSMTPRAVTPRHIYGVFIARRERYRALAQVGGKSLADALAEKYLYPGEKI